MEPARDPGSLPASPPRRRGDASRPGAERRIRRRAAERSVFANARRWLRPPRRLRPTRAGWCFFALVFGVGFAALNTGNNLLYMVLALMLSFLVLSGFLSEAALRGIRVRRKLPAEAFAGREARVALEIHNDQRRASAFAVVVEDRVQSAERDRGDRAAGRCFALRIPAGGRELRSYPLLADRRGDLLFRGFVVFTRFPFGLFSKSLAIEEEARLLVYPAIDPLPLPASLEDAPRSGDLRADDLAGRSPVAAGLRGYLPGDRRRLIHWPASQRAGALVVRDLESETDREVLVRLDTGGAAGEGFERRVRRAASEVVTLLDAGLHVGLEAGERSFEADAGARHRASLLGFLARVEPGGAPVTEAA